MISALGGPERRLTDAANGKITWSPDGQWLVVSDHDVAGGDSVAPPDGPAPGVHLEGAVSGFVVSVATGERHKLTASRSQATFDTDFTFAPDGGSLAFVRWAHTGAEVQVQKLTGSQAGPVASGAPKALTADSSFVRGLAWTPDSSQVVFASNRSGTWQVWKLPLSSRVFQPT